MNFLRLLVRGPWDTPRLNRDFVAICYALPTLLGSVGTAIFHGGGLWCLFLILTGRVRLVFDRHVVLITAAIVLMVSAMMLSAFLNRPVEKIPIDALWLWTFLVFPLSYAVLSSSSKASLISACILGSVIACFGGLILALVQFFIFGERAEGGAGNAIVFSTVATFSGALALAGAGYVRDRNRVICVAAFVASVIAISLSGTRGIWPAVPINILIVAIVYGPTMSRRVRIAGVIGFVALLAAAILFAGIMNPRFGDSVTDIERILNDDYQSSIGFRLAMWWEGAKIWLERPLLGFGPGSIPDLMATRINPAFDISISYSHMHNVFLTILVQSGLIGLAGFIGLVVIPIRLAISRLRDRAGPDETFGAVLLLVLFATYLTAGLSSIMIGHDILDWVFVLSLVVGSFCCCGETRPHQARRRG